MSNVTLDLNNTKCLVHQESIGEKIITNICSGEVTHIPWTFVDWVSAAGFSILLIFICSLSLVVLGVLAPVLFDLFRGN